MPLVAILAAQIAALVAPAPPFTAAVHPTPTVRRGDVVAVAAEGPGFRITVDAVAETDGVPGGRVRLRNRATGGTLQAEVGAGGEIWLPGFNNRDDSR